MAARAYWYAKFINLYVVYDKFPWELGYKPYVEFDSIFPFAMREINKKIKRDREMEKEYAEMMKGEGGS